MHIHILYITKKYTKQMETVTEDSDTYTQSDQQKNYLIDKKVSKQETYIY